MSIHLFKLKQVFSSDIIIVEPSLIMKNDEDAELVSGGFKLDRINIQNYITYRTKYSELNVYDIDPLHHKDTIQSSSYGKIRCPSKVISIIHSEQLNQYNKNWKSNVSKNNYIKINNFIGSVIVKRCEHEYMFGFGSKFFMLELGD